MKYVVFNHSINGQFQLTKYTYKNLCLLLTAIISCLFISCSKEEYENNEKAGGMHTIPMYLNGEFSAYSGQSTRAAKIIADGTTLYIKLLSGTDTIFGTAVYYSDKSEWSFTYEGKLKDGTSTCSACYFENPVSVGNFTAKLDKNSLVYFCPTGSYTYNSNGLTVTANLKPYLNRLRFKGESGTTISFDGLTDINSFTFDINNGIPTSTISDSITLTVSTDGYTPVLYYVASSNDSLKVKNGNAMYSRPNPLSSSPIGSSISIDIPTEDNYSGWTRTLIRQDHGDITIDDYDDWEDYSPKEHEAVDLGLSVKWATMNVGATSPEDYGDYFAWGETTGYNSGKTNFNWSSYKYCNGSATTMTKYCASSSYGTVDNKTVLESSDDTATANWGGDWRMPTDAEFTELRTSCTWTWITMNGVNGYKVASKINSNYIFLPAAGWRYNSDLNDVGTYGGYWSSTRSTSYSYYSYYMYFYSNYVGRDGDNRFYGRSVRPVCQ